MTDPRFFVPRTHDIKQAARLIGRSEKTLYNLAERRELGHFKIAGRLRFSDEHLAEFYRRSERPAKVAA